MSGGPQEVRLGRADAWALAGCAAASLALFGRLLSGQVVLFERDVLNQYWPMRAAVARAFAQGALPLLDGSQQAGVPLLGNPHVGALYPPNLLFQWLSFPVAYAWVLFLHHVLLTFGAYLFFRRLMPRPGAFAGAFVVGLSGYVVGLSCFGPMMSGLAWVGWVLFALSAPVPRARHAVLAGAALALQALSGDPMSAVHSGLLALALGVAWPEGGRRLGLLALAGAVGLGLSAVQLFPAWVAFTQSTRVGEEALALEWSLHPARALELLGPYPWGGYLEVPGFWASFLGGRLGLPFVLSVYPSVVALCLAVAGAAKTRLTALAGACVAAGVLLALGAHGPFGWLLVKVPPFRFFQYPEKYWFLALVGLGLLAGEGFTRLSEGPSRRWAPVPWVAASAAGLVLVRGFPSATGALFADAPRASLARASFSQALLVGLGFAAVALVLFVARGRLGARLWPALAGLVLSFDLLSADWQLVWTAPRELYELRPPLAAQLQALAGPGPFRYWRDHGPLEARVKAPGDHRGFVVRRAWDVDSLKSNLGGVYGLEELSGYSPLRLARWERLMEALQGQWWKAHALFAAPLGYSVPESPRYQDAERFELVARGPLDTAIFRARAVDARLFSPPRVAQVAGPEQAIARVVEAGFDPLGEAVVEGEVPRDVARAALLGATVQAQRASVEADVPAGQALVVLSQSWYPGWRARVDGRAVPVVPVDAALLGAWVPEGHHQVSFEYSEPSLPWGAAVSALTLLLCVLGWVTKFVTPTKGG